MSPSRNHLDTGRVGAGEFELVGRISLGSLDDFSPSGWGDHDRRHYEWDLEARYLDRKGDGSRLSEVVARRYLIPKAAAPLIWVPN